MILIKTYTQQETLHLGESLGRLLPRGAIVSLVAPLGAGKTWLSKGLAKGIGGHEHDDVTSPAFTLVNEYFSDGGPTIYHIDFYRLDELTPEDFQMFDEYLTDPDAISIVEWGNKFLPSIAPEHLQVSIGFADDEENARTFGIEIIGDRERYAEVVNQLERV